MVPLPPQGVPHALLLLGIAMLNTLANGRVRLFIEPTNLFMLLGLLGFFAGNHVGQKLQAARRRRSVLGFPILHLTTEWIGLLGHDCLLQKR